MGLAREMRLQALVILECDGDQSKSWGYVPGPGPALAPATGEH